MSIVGAWGHPKFVSVRPLERRLKWVRRGKARVSAINAVTASPKRRRLGLYFQLLSDDTNAHGEDHVDFLQQLRRHISGPMTVLWDRGNIHDRSNEVWAYLEDHLGVLTG